MPNQSWREAIQQVLTASGEPLHYTDIAEAVVSQELRDDVGATPAATVNATICMSLQNDGDQSPFIRVARGVYSLRGAQARAPEELEPSEEKPTDEAGLINAFGMFWSRSSVLWTSTPKILGQQQPGSAPVDFAGQHGVYLLHDGRAVVYVGRATDQVLGARLRQHTFDRLNGRWDRFSWFGIYPATEDGTLDTEKVGAFTKNTLITTMEALLIEGLEPPQNRKRGDDFRAVEFLQVEDPQIQKDQIVKLMDELKKKL